MFIVAGWLLNLTPGPDVLYIVSNALRSGTRAGIVAGLGITAGCFVHICAAAVGVGALLAASSTAFTLLKWLGAAYLLWLGAQVIRHPAVPEAGQGAADRPRDWVRRGFLVSGMNPKALLLMLALLPQFTRAQAPWAVELQIGALGLVQMLNCAVVYSLVAVASRLVLRTRPAAARRVSRLSGVAMIAVAALLLAEQLARHAYL